MADDEAGWSGSPRLYASLTHSTKAGRLVPLSNAEASADGHVGRYDKFGKKARSQVFGTMGASWPTPRPASGKVFSEGSGQKEGPRHPG